jgi:hypothetical protein
VTAAGIVAFLASRGHTIELVGSDLMIRPELEGRLISRVRARKLDIVAFLSELGAPAATARPFPRSTLGDHDGRTRQLRDVGELRRARSTSGDRDRQTVPLRTDAAPRKVYPRGGTWPPVAARHRCFWLMALDVKKRD